MDTHGLTVRLVSGHEPGTVRVVFLDGTTWIATFHTCGETVGIAVVRPGSEAREPALRRRAEAVVKAALAFKRKLTRLANGRRAP